MSEDIVEKLRGSACGHPFAKINWPHRVLHEAADEIEKLRRECSEAKEARKLAVDRCHLRSEELRQRNAENDILRKALVIDGAMVGRACEAAFGPSWSFVEAEQIRVELEAALGRSEQ